MGDAYDAILSDDGVLLKFLGLPGYPGAQYEDDFTGPDFSGGFKPNSPNLVDCQPDQGSTDNCGAWNFFRKGLVPIVYTYPQQTHGVGIIVQNSPDVWSKINYLHIVDAATLGRTASPGQVDPGDAQFYPTCPNQGKDHLDVICKPEPVETKFQVTCQKDETKGPDYYYYAYPIGVNGEKWIEQFMRPSPDFNQVEKDYTDLRQCSFTREEKELFLSVLDQYYTQVTSAATTEDPVPDWAKFNAKNTTSDDDKFYLENEINTDTPFDELKALITPYINGVWVQTQLCTDTYPSSVFSESDCMKIYGGNEGKFIARAKYAGCRTAEELTKWKYGDKASDTLYVPVFGVSFVPPLVPDKKKYDFFRDPSTKPEDYMQVLDCKKILAEHQ